MQTNQENQPQSSERRSRRSPRSISLLEPTVCLLCAAFGAIVAYQLAKYLTTSSFAGSFNQLGTVFPLISFSLFGFAGGFAGGLYVGQKLRKGLNYIDEVLTRISGMEVVAGIIGALLGLVIAALAGVALFRIPLAGPYLIVPVYFLSSYFTSHLMMKKHADILRLFGIRVRYDPTEAFIQPKVLDSSVLIDGRILDVYATGFLEGDLLVPRFVLEEMQRLADSADAEKRVRGRRGLDFVQKLQASEAVVRIDESVYKDVEEVDAKLVRLASEINATLITTDAPLLKIAEIQGIQVLNINDLANALKPAVLPGEIIEVKIVREGREQNQGVGYFDDGTMIVVESGADMMGSLVKAEVTSVLQGPSGKMVFSKVAS